MLKDLSRLEPGKKLYFASDFHLGVPSKEDSLVREKKIVDWLDQIQPETAALFLLGDIFDFWFEYKHVIPKGFTRFLGRLANFTDQGIPVIFFTGNHDMWMFDFFPSELSIPVYRKPQSIEVDGKRFLIGHGDGLGPGDRSYKLLKRIFANHFCQWAFGWLHPNLGMPLAHSWSRNSRINNQHHKSIPADKDKLLLYCKKKESQKHRDYYIFGHSHEPVEFDISQSSRYINIGEWVNYFTYAVFDGSDLLLKTYKG